MKNVLIRLATDAATAVPAMLLILGLVCGTGCRSTESTPSASFASVVISGNTPGQIRDAAVEVFTEDGYKVAQTDPNSLIFEKEGTRLNNFAYGNWLGDTPVWVRVRATVVPLGQMSCRLQCHAYMLRDHGGATEEEIPVSRLHKGQYQKLLDEVANKFAKK